MRTYTKEISIALIIAISVTLFSIYTNLDLYLADKLYSKTTAYGEFMQKYGQIPALLGSIVALIFLTFARFFRHRISDFATWKRVAAVWIMTLAIGSGLIVNQIMKEHTKRPRPKHTIELGGQYDYKHPFDFSGLHRGKSFPSGHASVGFLLFAPFFVLVGRNRKKLAYTFLTAGIVYGSAVGLGRMMSGSHFFTDVVWSGSIMAIVAALSASFLAKPWKSWMYWAFPAFTFVAVLAVLLITPFEKNVYFEDGAKVEIYQLDLPCSRIEVSQGESYYAHVKVTGYGGPRTHITLEQDGNRLYIKEGTGFFREVSCTAKVKIPELGRVSFDKNIGFSAIGVIPEIKENIVHFKR